MSTQWFIAAAIIAALVGYLMLFRGRTIDSREAHRLVDSGALLVDVRTPSEFASGHIDGAVNIPVQELDHRLSELGAKDRAIVVYCRSGSRSAKATTTLASAGYTSVHDLGGIGNW